MGLLSVALPYGPEIDCMIGEAWTILIASPGPEPRRGPEAAPRRLGPPLSNSSTPSHGRRPALGARVERILDVATLDSSVFHLLEAMRDEGGLTRCPVVALVADPTREVIAGLLRAGAMDYLGKGWTNPDSLTRTVEGSVERFALVREERLAVESLRRRRNGIACSSSRRSTASSSPARGPLRGCQSRRLPDARDDAQRGPFEHVHRRPRPDRA